jgi:hypothetical protein
MINNDPLIQEFTAMVTRFYFSLQKLNKLNMLNATVASEKWVEEVCSVLWNQKFKRSSIFTANADSYDLEGGAIAVQVTSNMSAEKIVKTITDFDAKKHAVDHPVLYIFLLGDRPDYTSKALETAVDSVTFDFDRKQHIIGTDQLIALVANLDIGPLKQVVEVSRAYFESESTSLIARRSCLEQKVSSYKERLRPMLERIFHADSLAEKYSHKPSSQASCERTKAVLSQQEGLCKRMLALYARMAEAIPSATSRELDNVEKLAIKSVQNMDDMDFSIEQMMRHLERTWELGSLIDDMEASKKKIAGLTETLAELDEEKRTADKQMQSLEFAMKILAP